MMRLPQRQNRRHGVAAVEAAVVSIPLMLFMVGIWEVGRLVQVKQVCVNATREGARLAALGFNINTTGDFSYVYTKRSGTPPTGQVIRYVEDTVMDCLIGAGITNVNNVDTVFTYTSLFDATQHPTTPVEPWEGQKGDEFSLTVSVPYGNFGWTRGTLVPPSTILKSTVNWMMLTDDPFKLNADPPAWNGVVDPIGG